MGVRTADFDYELPEELIAQTPALQREQSRLMVLSRQGQTLDDRRFFELPELLQPGDLLILNNSRVIPARIRGVKEASGGQAEFLLYEETYRNVWWTMAKPAKRLSPGTRVRLLDLSQQPTDWILEMVQRNAEGHLQIIARNDKDPDATLTEDLENLGEWPLPPYIQRSPADPLFQQDAERYQTVYAQEKGSVAAPTAGLHFTPQILNELERIGVEIDYVTLHVGIGTFAPVKVESVEDHVMHDERYEVPTTTLARILQAKAEGRRVIAVGTTSLRTLESLPVLSELQGQDGISGRTRLFIYPPYQFKIVDGLITNFHLPQSTLLMLVSAFAAPGEKELGKQWILSAYREAVARKYRFFSYGDAMFVR